MLGTGALWVPAQHSPCKRTHRAGISNYGRLLDAERQAKSMASSVDIFRHCHCIKLSCACVDDVGTYTCALRSFDRRQSVLNAVQADLQQNT